MYNEAFARVVLAERARDRERSLHHMRLMRREPRPARRWSVPTVLGRAVWWRRRLAWRTISTQPGES